MSDLSAKRQTFRKEGTQSHGTYTVSRATEQIGRFMDQRGYSVDPSETASPVLPVTRLTAWAGVAARISAISQVPAQSETAAA